MKNRTQIVMTLIGMMLFSGGLMAQTHPTQKLNRVEVPQKQHKAKAKQKVQSADANVYPTRKEAVAAQRKFVKLEKHTVEPKKEVE